MQESILGSNKTFLKTLVEFKGKHRCTCISGPGCSTLTMSLVNISLEFQTLISQIYQYFLSKNLEKLLHLIFCTVKASLIFSTKNISVFGYKVIKYLMS